MLQNIDFVKKALKIHADTPEHVRKNMASAENPPMWYAVSEHVYA